MKIRSLLSLSVGLSACLHETPVEIGTVERCSLRICGGNSPTIDHYGFWELNVDGVANAQGFELLGLSQVDASGRAAFYDVAVVDSQLRARDARGGELVGSQLVGATIWLQRGSDQYGVVISNVGTFEEVVDPPAAPPVGNRPIFYPPRLNWPIFGGLGLKPSKLTRPALSPPPAGQPRKKLETYVLDWSAVVANPLPNRMPAGATGIEIPEVDGKFTHVCPPPTTGGGGGQIEWDPTSALDVYQTLLFEGDRFDLETRTVESAPDDKWFNIGCGTHTLAKMRLTRNTIHTAPGWQNVQAALKMFSADYCGTGSAYTVDGEPLVWRDRGSMHFWQNPRELEARWDENGAICLDSPRLLRSTSPLAPHVFDWAEITKECADVKHSLPPCTESDPTLWQGSELVVSGNYD